MNKFNNVIGLIGNTPIVRINKLNKNKKVEVYAKLEGQNPGGSVKDRIAYYMIEQAEKNGELTKDKIILEPTSGNTGIGLAMVAAVKGYKIILTMSEAMSEERKKVLKAYGAELVLTDPTKGTDGAIIRAKEMIEAEPDKYWMPNQFANQNNPEVHYQTTGKEIIEQLPEITHFVAGMGTTGTLMGVARRLKEYNPKIQIIGAEPILNHKIAGLKNMEESIRPAVYNAATLDQKITVENDEAYEMARALAKEEGIFAGMSAGGAMAVALKLAKDLESGKIVVILPDRGDRYTSTLLYS